DVLGQVPGGHSEVNRLVSGQGVELLQSRLYVVTEGPLPLADRLQIDVGDTASVGLDHRTIHIEAEIDLGLEHRHPQFSLETDLGDGIPHLDHLGRGVAGGEDVLDHCSTSIAAPRTPDESPCWLGTSRVATSPPKTYRPQIPGTRS